MKNMRTNWIVLALIFLAFAGVAQVPRILNYQGLLTGNDGKPVPEGTYSLSFTLYDANGTSLWSEVQPQVIISGGLLQVALGTIVPLNLPFDKPYWLGIKVGNDAELSPRMPLQSSAYSLRADDADRLSGVEVSTRPAAGKLLPLDRYGKFPSSVLTGSAGSGNYLLKDKADTSSIQSSDPVMLLENKGDGNALYCLAADGRGIMSVSTNHDGVSGLTSAANRSGIYGQTDNSEAFGVFGRNKSTTSYGYLGGMHGVFGWSKAVFHAGHFEATGGLNYGVYATSSGDFSFAGSFVASGNYSYGLYAEGPTSDKVGAAALFKGNVEIKSRDSDETVLELGEGLDYAEGFEVTGKEAALPGTVLVIDPEHPGTLRISDRAYDSRVAGIVPGANGLGSGVRLGKGQHGRDVALAGRVYCNVDATFGAVAPGDLLTTSPTPGFAMVVRDYEKAHGTILGKAMQNLAAGHKGQILVLVTLQ
ncbi:MAG TPA: hypothetical protein PLN61_09770 [bacterium]|nr:hypothetical protein [bacterium]HQI48936.1 hypothetical protein [bacterium]HQJ64454.1 hypothetical protein [bacterium]